MNWWIGCVQVASRRRPFRLCTLYENLWEWHWCLWSPLRFL